MNNIAKPTNISSISKPVAEPKLSDAKSLSEIKALSEAQKLSTISEKDFLSLTFEQLNQIEVRLSESEKQVEALEAQKGGEVKSKPVDFLEMSFNQLTHLPVRVATLKKENKKEEKEIEGRTNPINLVDVPTVFSKQALKLNTPYVGEVHSLEKNLVDTQKTSTSSETTSTQSPQTTPVFIFFPIIVPQFLAVANSGTNTISILLRNSSGSFTVLAPIPVAGGQPFGVAVADLNHDNILDLVVTSTSTTTASVFLGTGIGTFGAESTFPVPFSTAAPAAIGDFNKDGNLDLIISEDTGSDIAILLGTGTGAFGAPTTFTAGSRPHGMVVGDFNQDGFLDLATANLTGNDLSVLLGTGTGAFFAASHFSAQTSPLFVKTGDFNGDNILDLIVTNNSSNNVSVFLGMDTGNFFAQIPTSVGPDPYDVAVGDFNRDHILDIAVTSATSNKIFILLGTGTGSFGAPFVISSGGSQAAAIVTGDFNEDGFLDLACANASASSNNIGILFGNGNGTFQSPVTYTVGGSPVSIAMGVLFPAGIAGEPINLSLSNPSANIDTLITLIIKDIPSEWSLNAGIQQSDGTWIVQTNDFSTLTVTTPVDFVGARALSVEMHWSTQDGNLSSSYIIENIEVYSPGSAIFALPGDNLSGSVGADIFVISKSLLPVQDTIFNFDTADDQINLIGFKEPLQFSDLLINSDNMGNTLVHIDSDDHTILLKGIDEKDVNEHNFMFEMTNLVTNTGLIDIGQGAVMPFAGTLENEGIIQVNGSLIMNGDITGTGTIILGDSGIIELNGHIDQVIFFGTELGAMQINALNLPLATITSSALQDLL